MEQHQVYLTQLTLPYVIFLNFSLGLQVNFNQDFLLGLLLCQAF